MNNKYLILFNPKKKLDENSATAISGQNKKNILWLQFIYGFQITFATLCSHCLAWMNCCLDFETISWFVLKNEVKPKIIKFFNKSNPNKYLISFSFIFFVPFFLSELFMEIQSYSSSDSLTMINGFWPIKKLSKHARITDNISTIVWWMSNVMENYYSFQYELSLEMRIAYRVYRVVCSVCDFQLLPIPSYQQIPFSRHYYWLWLLLLWQILWSIVEFHSHQDSWKFLIPLSTTYNDQAHTEFSESIIYLTLFSSIYYFANLSISSPSAKKNIFSLPKLSSIDLMLVWPISWFSSNEASLEANEFRKWKNSKNLVLFSIVEIS